MTRAKVFGEDVLITLKSNDTLTPLILDFDSCEVTSLRQNHSYKSISKKVTRTISASTGYKIVLTRAKRDNYIEAISQYIDFFTQRGLEPPLFSLERVVNMQYGVDEIIPQSEFFGQEERQIQQRANEAIKRSQASAEAKKNQLLRIGGEIANLATNNIPAVANANRKIGQTLNQIQNAQNNLSSFISKATALNPFSPANAMDDPEWIAIDREAQFNNSFIRTMQSIYVYQNCSIAEETFSDKSRELTDEKITLYASSRLNLSTINDYDDTYLYDHFSKLAVSNIEKMYEHIEKTDSTKDQDMLKRVKELYNVTDINKL